MFLSTDSQRDSGGTISLQQPFFDTTRPQRIEKEEVKTFLGIPDVIVLLCLDFD